MTTNSLVSIVIPHFNRLRLLRETILSIRAQTYENWEVIVVDDGSEEHQWVALQELATDRVSIVQRRDGMKGPSRCRNLGAAKARGEYLVFVDSDDILAPWCLDQRLECAKRTPRDLLWIFPVMLFNQVPGDLAVSWNRLDGDEDLERFLRSDPPWHTSSPLWRRDAFLSLGGFNEEVFYGDDADLHIKMLLTGLGYRKFQSCLPDAFVRRGSEQRITSSTLRLLVESRQTRLTEGTRLLREFGASPAHSDLWEGQYFVEGEELLFSRDGSEHDIRDVICAWMEHYQPSAARVLIVKLYFALGIRCRDRLYLALRITRRLVMFLLPEPFFPRGGHFHCWRVSDQAMGEIRDQLVAPQQSLCI